MTALLNIIGNKLLQRIEITSQYRLYILKSIRLLKSLNEFIKNVRNKYETVEEEEKSLTVQQSFIEIRQRNDNFRMMK